MQFKVKIATCNVNGLVNKSKLRALLKWLKFHQASVLYLQETHLKSNSPNLVLPRFISHSFVSSATAAVEESLFSFLVVPRGKESIYKEILLVDGSG